jgi:uncharacterized repeat protein (TIGR03803 family)
MKPHLQIFALILAVFNGLTLTGIIAQNSEFYGMTPTGGINNTGAIFKTDGNGNNFQVIFSFPSAYPHGQMGSLMLADNGKFYGTTFWGGAYGAGVIYEWDPATGILTKKLDFEGGKNAGYPSELIQAGNGKVYLLTGGGENNMGTLSEWDPVSNTLTKRLDFNSTDNGRDPDGSMVEMANGKLYGTTRYGGTYDAGIFFEWDPASNTFTKKFDFDGGQLGFDPGIFCLAKNGKLYTVTVIDGGYVLYEWDPDSNIYSEVFDFAIEYMNIGGAVPLMQANNGKLYGMLSGGFNNGGGVLFELDLDSANSTKLLEFSMENGQHPGGMLVEGDNGKLYGMNNSGGNEGKGALFELDLVTHTFIKKMDFTGAENGSTPVGSLIKAENGKLYGKTAEGGAYNFGVLFEWDPGTDTFTKKFDFKGTENGRYPRGSLVQVKNGNLYGTTEAGGLYEKGMLFKLDPSSNTFTKILDFNGTENGSTPTGYMIEADNGNLYGLTQRGDVGYDTLHPAFENGVLFEFNPTTETLTKKVDFNGFEKGSSPMASLVKANNGKLYGMTWSGGAFDEWFKLGFGVLFEYDPVNDIYTKKMDFNPFQNDGFAPGASLIQADNGKLYGSAPIGGEYVDDNHWGGGVLFEWDPATDIYTKMKVFNQPEDGISPGNTLVQADNGKFYGATIRGGIYTHTEPVGEVSNGVLYEWDPATNTYTKKLDLNETETGFMPVGPFLQAENGKLYGMNSNGGAYKRGVFFEWDPVTNVFSKKLDLGGNELLTNAKNSLFYQKNTRLNGRQEKKGINGTGNNVELNGFDGANYSGGLVEVKHSITGLEANTLKSKITFYPNPTESSFTIDLGKTYSTAEITITQLDGRIVSRDFIINARLKDLQIPGSPGLYMVSVISGNECAVVKIAKK